MLKYLLLLLFLFFVTPALALELKQGDWVFIDKIVGTSVEVVPYGSLQPRLTIKLKDIPCKVEEGHFLLVKEYVNDKLKVECFSDEEPEGC
jgi:hypothetical protein